MKNRILVTIIATVMILSSILNIQTFAVEYTKEYALLKSLGVITEEINKNIDSKSEFMTREEAAIYIVNLFNMPIDFEQIADYVDVEAYSFASPYIDFCKKNGLFEQMDRKRFRPKDNITLEEISIVLTRVLGFDKMYGISAQYPREYIMQAQMSGIITGIKKQNNGIVREDFFKILVNTLNANVCNQTAFGESSGFSVEVGDTLLKNRFEVLKTKGVVTGFGFLNLYGNEEIMNGKIAIDGQIYQTDYADYSAYVGHYVEVYLNISNPDDKVLKHIQIHKSSTEYSINGKEISDDSSLTKLYYDHNDRKTTINISQYAKMFFNGNNAGAITDEMLKKIKKDDTTTRFIDNNGDGIVDVIFIYQYDTYIVDSVNLKSKRVYIKYDKVIGDNKYIDLDATSSYKSQIFKNGALTTIENIKPYNVLSCIPTYDNNNKLVSLKIFVSSKVKTGKVESISEDGIFIAGSLHKISDSYKEIISFFEDTPEITLNSEGKFYLDILGNIAAVKANKEIYYGYLSKIYQKNKSKLSPEYSLEIYDEEGMWIEADLAEKVLLDGINVKADKAKDSFSQLRTFVPQVVRFSILNEKIKMLDTVKIGNKDAKYDVLKMVELFDSTFTPELGYITGNYYRFINESKIMIVPEDVKEKESYKLVNRFSFMDGQKMYIKIYEIDEFNCVKFSLVEQGAIPETNTYERKAMLVDKVTDVLNKDGEIIQRVYGLLSGDAGYGAGITNNTFLDSFEYGVFNGVKSGDVILYVQSSLGKVKKVNKIFTIDDLQNKLPFFINQTLKDEQSYGTILKVDTKRRLMLMDIAGEKQVFWLGAIVSYDVKLKKLEQIDISDLTEGKKVFNWGYWNHPFFTVMYIE